jgi:hypothetical protein
MDRQKLRSIINELDEGGSASVPSVIAQLRELGVIRNQHEGTAVLQLTERQLADIIATVSANGPRRTRPSILRAVTWSDVDDAVACAWALAALGARLVLPAKLRGAAELMRESEVSL